MSANFSMARSKSAILTFVISAMKLCPFKATVPGLVVELELVLAALENPPRFNPETEPKETTNWRLITFRETCPSMS